VRTAPAVTGKKCPALTQKRACNSGACPTDCVVNPWSAWDTCSRSCGTGFRTRKRAVVQPSLGGALCPMALETRLCNETPCPKDCVVSAWGSYGKCSVSCGRGFQTRHRHVLSASIGAGATCPTLSSAQECSSSPCPINCKVAAWSDLTPCSKPCGGGKSVRTRTVLVANAYGGFPCPHLSEQAACNTQMCPAQCHPLGTWGAWTACSTSCGTGTKVRAREPLGVGRFIAALHTPGSDDARHKLPVCEALTERASCGASLCPVDCKTSAWSEWQTCSKTCGTGTRKRYRSEIIAAAFGGKRCSGQLTQVSACQAKPCPVDCLTGDWDGWSRCTASCGTGFQQRSRKVLRQPAYGGASCSANAEKRLCNTFQCAVDCVVGSWGPWDSCSVQCGGGQQKRLRTATVLAQHGGKACAPRTSYQVCNTKICRCSHIRCHFALHAATGHSRIRVTHDANEFMGRKHKCGYNYQSQQCECSCYDKLAPQSTKGFWKNLPVALEDQQHTSLGNTYYSDSTPRGIPGKVLERNVGADGNPATHGSVWDEARV